MEKIIEKHLEKIVQSDLNRLPIEIDYKMSEHTQDKSEEWKIWYPIKSEVTIDEFVDFENLLGYKLPSSFKRFLSYKHFYELSIYECSFCSHPVNTWRASLNKMIFSGYPAEFLIQKGKIPFASWSDWGLLCFDTTKECINYDYPIVLWDHERKDIFEDKYDNFENLIFELDKKENNNAF